MAAWTETAHVGDLLVEFESRYKWTGELAVMGEWEAVDERAILTALWAMWNDWRDVVEPALAREMARAAKEGPAGWGAQEPRGSLTAGIWTMPYLSENGRPVVVVVDDEGRRVVESEVPEGISVEDGVELYMAALRTRLEDCAVSTIVEGED